MAPEKPCKYWGNLSIRRPPVGLVLSRKPLSQVSLGQGVLKLLLQSVTELQQFDFKAVERLEKNTKNFIELHDSREGIVNNSMDSGNK